jgi:ADP-heptose:LPS heptosyltransferase
MDIKHQIIIDKFIAKPIAYLLNFLVRIVGQLTSINHDLDRDFKSIAICKFKGMGSILQATPMIEAIRIKYPSAQIIFVSTISNQKILEKIPAIDTIVTINESSFTTFLISNLKALFQLIKIRPDVYIDLEIYSDYSTLFTLSTLSKNRIGFYLRSSSFRMGIYTHMMFFNPRVPISNVYLQIALLLGCDSENSKLLSLKDKLLDGSKPKREYIVINPNASDLRLERKWGKDNFIQLIDSMLNNYPEFDILLVGSKMEEVYTSEISTSFTSPRIINTAGKTSIDELIEIIANARLMISNDTGPMHIAFCTDTPIICLFGPCSPDQYGMNKNAHVIYKNAYCSPCVHDFEIPPCKGDNICMKLISTDDVYQKVGQLLNNTTESNSPANTFIYKNESTVFGKVNR